MQPIVDTSVACCQGQTSCKKQGEVSFRSVVSVAQFLDGPWKERITRGLCMGKRKKQTCAVALGQALSPALIRYLGLGLQPPWCPCDVRLERHFAKFDSMTNTPFLRTPTLQPLCGKGQKHHRDRTDRAHENCGGPIPHWLCLDFQRAVQQGVGSKTNKTPNRRKAGRCHVKVSEACRLLRIDAFGTIEFNISVSTY